MKKTRLAIATSLGLLAGCGTIPQAAPLIPQQASTPTAQAKAPAVAAPPKDVSSAVPGEIIVKFKAGQSTNIPGADEISDVLGIPGAHVYKLQSGTYDTQSVASLADDPRIEWAEPRYLCHAADVGQPVYYPDPTQADMFNEQWDMFKVAAPAAWGVVKGNSSVLVADVDSGVDYTHPALQESVVKGHNFVDGNDDPMDDPNTGHGTHTAGTIAANGSVVGVAFGVKVLAVKVLDSNDYGTDDQVAAGIDYAVQAGVKILNLSAGDTDLSNVLDEAIANATKSGVLCVVAAGNDGTTAPFYPAVVPGVLAVGSVGMSDARSTWSNYGSYVNIAAPGENIVSTLPGGYGIGSGTSMAAPHVAGAAALLLSRYPQLTVDQLSQALTQSGDPTTGFTQSTVKRLNVKSALDLAGQDTAPGAPASPAPSTTLKVSVFYTTEHSADIHWQTSTPTTGEVYFGDYVRAYGAGMSDGALSTKHSLTLPALVGTHTYHYTVVASTPSGQQVDSGDLTFRTKRWWIF
ncbi:MAG: S8 family serine peptidase [Cyanobacteria bacterium REEB65]|nr:S8 family serine peptidase [Cyanobacteria bacterium REEB65]